MADKLPITAERLREVLSYDPDTGVFTWRVDRGRKTSGIQAGSLMHGYPSIMIDGRNYFSHRLAWLYTTGDWPPGQIDHHDMDKTNNRWVNLRIATRSQNGANRRALRVNTSGFKGVCWDSMTSNWKAQISVRGKNIHLGRYYTQQEAHAAYCRAAQEYFGEFARTG